MARPILSERWLRIQVLFLLPIVDLMLQWIGLRRTRRLLSLCHPELVEGSKGRLLAYISGKKSGPVLQQAVQHLAGLVVKINREHAWYPATCLPESLTLWYILQRHGVPAQFRIGVRKLLGKFEAHAWVEYEGIPLNDTEQVRFIYAPFEGI